MSLKRCVKCGSQWSSALPRCAFCGGEPQEVEVPKVVVKLQSERAAEKAIEAELAAASEPETPVEAPAHEPPEQASGAPEPLNDAPPPEAETRSGPEAEPEPEPGPGPEPEPEPEPEPAPPPVREPEPVAKKVPPPPPKPVPAEPSAKLPLIFSFAALVGCAALPATVRFDSAKVLGAGLDVIALIAAALLAPLAPAAWVLGTRCEHARGEKNLSTFGARLARRIGAVLTAALALEFAALAGFLALARIFGRLDGPFFSGGVK